MSTEIKTPRPITYPFITMNHLAMMLTVLNHRLFFPKQAEQLFGCPIHVLSPKAAPDNNHPLAAWHYSRDTILPIAV